MGGRKSGGGNKKMVKMLFFMDAIIQSRRGWEP